jgi:hypothetical protein
MTTTEQLRIDWHHRRPLGGDDPGGSTWNSAAAIESLRSILVKQ